MCPWVVRVLLNNPRADSLSASEYESGFRAGEREPLRTSRARARFLQGCLLHPFRERYTYVTRSQQRSQQLRNDIVFALLRSRALGRAFLCLCSSSSVRSRARGLCAGASIAGDQRRLCSSWRSCSSLGVAITLQLLVYLERWSGASTY